MEGVEADVEMTLHGGVSSEKFIWSESFLANLQQHKKCHLRNFLNIFEVL